MIRKCILATLPLLVGAVLTASPALAIQTDVVVAKPADAAAPADAAPAKKETVKKVRRHRAVVDTNSTVPVRGMSMAQVEKRFGAPVDKLPAAGGDAWIVDSPGMKAFGLAHLDPAALAHAFVEMRPFLGQCRFRDCRHDREPGCAIAAAVAAGAVAPHRLALLHALVREAGGK